MFSWFFLSRIRMQNCNPVERTIADALGLITSFSA
jgi:hypothetical protein